MSFENLPVSIGVAASALSVATIVYMLSALPAARRPTHGLPGLKRSLALQRNRLFRVFEPILRHCAAWTSKFPVGHWRVDIAKQVQRSGEYLGLTPDEYLALMLIGAFGFSVAGIAICLLAHVKPLYALLGSCVGFFTPVSLVHTQISTRRVQVNRGLPAAIDLAALCMSAGMDFIGALRQIVANSADSDDAVQEELERILQELELGHTRRHALENFAARVPTDAVKDFTSSVIQAEEKGNPLSEVLQVQASMLRMRRSVLAEEAAARAGLLMMIPLMMLFTCIMLLLLGPLVINNLQGGL
jgi:tight adherence protein C